MNWFKTETTSDVKYPTQAELNFMQRGAKGL